MKIAKSLIAVVGMVCLFASCSTNEENNSGQLGASADFKVVGRLFDIKTTASKWSFYSVGAGLKDIEFKHEAKDGSLTNVPLKGQYSVDLLGGQTTPKMSSVELIPGKYIGFEASIASVNQKPSFSFSGMYTSADNKSIEFDFITHKTFNISYSSRKGFVIKADDAYGFIMTFVLPTLFEGVDMDAVQLTDGVIRINDEVNSAVKAAIEANIEKNIEYVYQVGGVSLPF